MDIVERVKQALRDNIEAALPSNIVIDYDYPARAAIEAAGVDELADALSNLTVELAASDDEGLLGYSEAFKNARSALAKHRGK